MKKKELLKLLNEVEENGEETQEGQRILLIDALNLFFRNFAILNMVNPEGVHIGGLGGFFRSLGALIRQFQPTSVYVVFDGVGSTTNRKNLLPEYKGNRDTNKITNWEVFDDYEEEEESKIDQITRIIQYLKTLPVKTVSINKVEADDIIAHLSKILPQSEKDVSYIVSSDKDYIQLINNNTLLYRPIEKKLYNKNAVIEKYNLPAHNFIIYKSLMKDTSDNIKGIKGLGEKKLHKLFPEIREKFLTLDDIFEICEQRLKEHVIYARILQDRERLKTNYKVMDLSKPMIDNNDENYLSEVIKPRELNFDPKSFLEMYEEDKLGGIIRDVKYWVTDIFENLKTTNNDITNT